MSDREPAHRPAPVLPPPRRLAPAALVLLFAACGLFSRQPGDVSRDDAREAPIRVKATNLAWKNIHVYAIAGASWQSLGVLSSQGEETWELAVSLTAGRREIRLAADPVGSRRAFISDPVLVEPGDLVEWTIQDNLALSSVFVR